MLKLIKKLLGIKETYYGGTKPVVITIKNGTNHGKNSYLTTNYEFLQGCNVKIIDKNLKRAIVGTLKDNITFTEIKYDSASDDNISPQLEIEVESKAKPSEVLLDKRKEIKFNRITLD